MGHACYQRHWLKLRKCVSSFFFSGVLRVSTIPEGLSSGVPTFL